LARHFCIAAAFILGTRCQSSAIFRHNVHSALAEVRNGRFEKIVLSHSITIQVQLDIQALLR